MADKRKVQEMMVVLRQDLERSAMALSYENQTIRSMIQAAEPVKDGDNSAVIGKVAALAERFEEFKSQTR